LSRDGVRRPRVTLRRVVTLAVVAGAGLLALLVGRGRSAHDERASHARPSSPIAVARPPRFVPPPPAPAPPPRPSPTFEAPTDDRAVVTYRPDGSDADMSVKGFSGAPTIRAFDPRLWNVVRGDRFRLAYLSYAEPVRACARAFVLRHRYDGWVLGGLSRITMTIAEEVGRFDAVEITNFDVTGFGDRPPDDAFLACFSAATKRLRIDCAGCRTGTLSFNWKLTPRSYDAAGETLHNAVDPVIADSAFHVVADPATP
jgi:hypothetical protein